MLTINGTFVQMGDQMQKLEDVIAQYNALESQVSELEKEKEKRDKEMLEVKTLNATLVSQSKGVAQRKSADESIASLYKIMNGG